jgi:hypothetical protein
MLYYFSWVTPWYLNLMRRCFRMLCLFHLHRSCLVHMTHEDGTGWSKAFTLTIQILGEPLKRKNTTKDCCSTLSVNNGFSFMSLLNKNIKMTLKGRSYNIIGVQPTTQDTGQVSSNSLHMLQTVQQLLGSLHNSQRAYC